MITKKYALNMDYLMGIDKKTYTKDLLYGEHPFTRVVPESRGFIHNHINKYGFRSDDFVLNHDKMHILFSGCSMTWGTGLNIEHVWAKQVYDIINKKNDCSGFFNLGSPGTSFIFQVFNLFKYFNIYGNPNLIVINMPDILRFYNYDIINKYIVDASYKDNTYEIFSLLNYQIYLMLEKYCLTNNINLICFSYDINTENLFKSFNTFYKIEPDKIENLLFNNPDNEQNMLIANDKQHLGILFHKEWVKKIMPVLKLKGII